MEAYQIVNQVQEKFKRVARKLSGITGKTSEWFCSHGREPKTQNPLQTGNASPVTHFMQYCRQYEAEKGAGLMLSARVHAELEMEFSSGTGAVDEFDCALKAMHGNVLREAFDVLDCLNKFEFSAAELRDVRNIEQQAAELRDISARVVARSRVIIRIKEAQRNGNGASRLETIR